MLGVRKRGKCFILLFLIKQFPLSFHYVRVHNQISNYISEETRRKFGSISLSVFYDYCLETNNNDQCLQIIGFDQKVNEILIMCLNSCLTATNHGRFWNELFFPQHVAISSFRHLAFQQVDTKH